MGFMLGFWSTVAVSICVPYSLWLIPAARRQVNRIHNGMLYRTARLAPCVLVYLATYLVVASTGRAAVLAGVYLARWLGLALIVIVLDPFRIFSKTRN
jgi:hypothetical protein